MEKIRCLSEVETALSCVCKAYMSVQEAHDTLTNYNKRPVESVPNFIMASLISRHKNNYCLNVIHITAAIFNYNRFTHPKDQCFIS